MTERPTRTFDFGEHAVSESSVEDVDSTADELMVARGGVNRSRLSRVRHRPADAHGGGVNWGRVGALAGVASAIAAIVFGIIQLL
jgi:hypothetical protein